MSGALRRVGWRVALGAMLASLPAHALDDEAGLERGSQSVRLDEVRAQRSRLRVRASIGAAGGGGVGDATWAAGLGIDTDFGVVVRDRVTLAVRVTAVTSLVLHTAQAGVSVGVALSEIWHLSIGAAALHNGGLFVADRPVAWGFVVPLRAEFALAPREASRPYRSGLVLGVTVSPGVAVSFGGYGIGSRPETTPGFALTGLLTLSYGVW